MKGDVRVTLTGSTSIGIERCISAIETVLASIGLSCDAAGLDESKEILIDRPGV
jgi:hypothetical protein